jgi:hypothetical protein
VTGRELPPSSPFAGDDGTADPAVAAALAALGTVAAMVNPPADPVIAVALTVAALVFGVAALLLLRPRR